MKHFGEELILELNLSKMNRQDSWSRWSNREHIYPPCEMTKKKNKPEIYETMVFRHWTMAGIGE